MSQDACFRFHPALIWGYFGKGRVVVQVLVLVV